MIRYQLTKEDYLQYYTERNSRKKGALVKGLIFFFIGSLLCIFSWYVKQEAFSILLFIIFLLTFIAFIFSAKLSVFPLVKRGVINNDISFSIIENSIILIIGTSKMILSQSEIKNIIELDNFFHVEHKIGYNFPIPKKKLSNEERSILVDLCKISKEKK